MKIRTLDNLLKKFFLWFSNDRFKIFMFAIIFGFGANILVITANIVFADTIVFTDYYIANVWDLSLGRWGLYYADHLRFGLSSSVVSTILALIYLSFSAILIIDLLKIKGKVSKFLTAGLLVTAPFLFETLFSSFCSSEYLLAFLLSVIAVYIVYNSKKYVISTTIASLLLAISLGLYQAYIGVASALCVFIPVIYLLRNEYDKKYVFKKFLQSLVMGILAIVFYVIILNIILALWNVSLESYSGANEIGLKNFLMLPELIINAYRSFYQYFFTDVIMKNDIYNREWVHLILSLLTAISIILILFQNKKLNWQSRLFIIFCLLISPIAVCLVELIAPERDISLLMAAPLMIVYIFTLSIIEFKETTNTKAILNWGIIICCVFVFISNFVMSNASYMAVRVNKDKTVTAITRVMNIIWDNEEYTPDMPIMFAGNGESGYLGQRTNGMFNLATGHTAESPLVWGSNVDNCNTGWQKLINYYLGYKINVVDYETHMKILDTEEFAEMPIFPSKDAVQIINEVMVVKFENDSSRVR
ncbi:MAG TPA: glucosyltransferase domain-containing protein [Candidatus Onthocola stercorigallinarum]|nr:glucosyltransferase domain-containing protein [Candidatus Onthocola stercorigallinarum]